MGRSSRRKEARRAAAPDTPTSTLPARADTLLSPIAKVVAIIVGVVTIMATARECSSPERPPSPPAADERGDVRIPPSQEPKNSPTNRLEIFPTPVSNQDPRATKWNLRNRTGTEVQFPSITCRWHRLKLALWNKQMNEGGNFSLDGTDVAAIFTPPIEEIKDGDEVKFTCPTSVGFGPNLRIDRISEAEIEIIVYYSDTRSPNRLSEQRRFLMVTDPGNLRRWVPHSPDVANSDAEP